VQYQHGELHEQRNQRKLPNSIERPEVCATVTTRASRESPDHTPFRCQKSRVLSTNRHENIDGGQRDYRPKSGESSSSAETKPGTTSGKNGQLAFSHAGDDRRPVSAGDGGADRKRDLVTCIPTVIVAVPTTTWINWQIKVQTSPSHSPRHPTPPSRRNPQEQQWAVSTVHDK